MTENKNDLMKYKKRSISKVDKVVTSLNLRRDQKDFLDKHNLELGRMVRDMIDEKMELFKKGKK